MGFSLKRALAGAVVGGAHAAGQVFDAQLAEAAKDRARELDLERAKEIAAFQADIAMDRENRRDEIKANRTKEDTKLVADNMREVRTAVREAGLDPDSVKGMKMAAGLADERGFTSIADKYRVRLETERSHLANEENRKLQAEAVREARAGRLASAGKEREDKSYAKFEKLVLNDINKDFEVTVLNPHKDDGSTVPDKSAIPTARNYALELYKQGVPPERISIEMNKLQDIMLNEHGLDPKIRGLVALERGQERLAADLQTKKNTEQFRSTSFGTQGVELPPGLRPKEQSATPVQQAGSGRYSAAGLPLDTGPSNVGTAPRAENIIDKAGNVIDVFTGGGQYGATVTPRGLLSR